MRMRKLRGPNKKMSMPFEMFRTHTQHVNLDDLESRFDAGTTIDLALLQVDRSGQDARRPGQDPRPRRADQEVHVHAHKFSAGARESIEGAGGTCTLVED